MSKVYLGHLPRDVSERDIERLFKGYGEINSIALLRGYGFVEFRDRRDADDAVYYFNGKDFMGERIVVEAARYPQRGERRGRDDSRDRGRDRSRDRFRDRGDRGDSRDFNRGRGRDRVGPQRTSYRLLVKNLSSSASWQDLKDFMRKAGEVSFSDAHKLRQGEGIVEFANEDGMENALRKLDGEELKGRRIELRKDSGGRGGGRNFSRGRGRSRSRSPFNSRRSRSRSRSRGRRGNSSRRSRSASRSPARSPARSPIRSRSGSRARSSTRSPGKANNDGERVVSSWEKEGGDAVGSASKGEGGWEVSNGEAGDSWNADTKSPVEA
ncbi:hypothetical protein BB559_001690 [Furculomyces boomerangus]|uniref:RRM domain-containing protein n=1 Tax=Furculomyces boomerangus TaxID=61424 RepID=A0A2T9Z162_9FUNG|nr:hypothetical protein BB559_001690 [Furculomyces boomerangus]